MPGEVASVASDAALAAALLAVDPAGLRGVVLRGPSGPERDRWLSDFGALQPLNSSPLLRLPLHAAPARLLGGLDLPATLEAGRPIFERGILSAADGGTLVIGCAERLDARAAALISSALDCREVVVERDGVTETHATSFSVVACDESVEDEDGVIPGLSDRLAMICVPDGGTIANSATWTADHVSAARACLASVEIREELLHAMDDAASRFGVRSMHVLLSALRVARASAALARRSEVSEGDLAAAGRLVIGPRAVMLPVEDSAQPPEQQSERDQPQAGASDTPASSAQDIIVAAAKSSVPPGLLAADASKTRSKKSGRAGADIKAAKRGRPAGTRPSRSERGARLNVFETLRAAAPWQPLRRRSSRQAQAIQIRADDFRVTRLKHKSETATIFAVDASGSTAVARMAEAKGAIELLLAQCYTRRDQVALIAFGGRGANVLLAPTRSLAKVRRDLTGLPGGGGTPLAAGISAAAKLAAQARHRGQTPLIILLTDGRANLAFDGAADRDRAMSDALAAAAAIKSGNLSGVVIDTSSRRASEQARRLAEAMGARYLPLPFGGAETLSHAVRQHAVRSAP